MTNEDAIKIIRGLLNEQLYFQRCIVRPYDDIRETKYRLALLHAVKALRHQTPILYLCDDRGCRGCENGTNPEHICNHTTNIAHARNFEAIYDEYETEPHLMCYVEVKPTSGADNREVTQ